MSANDGGIVNRNKGRERKRKRGREKERKKEGRSNLKKKTCNKETLRGSLFCR